MPLRPGGNAWASTTPRSFAGQVQQRPAECVNAQARNRGFLQQERVPGRMKVRNVLLFHAPAHNLMRTLALAVPELVGLGTAGPKWRSCRDNSEVTVVTPDFALLAATSSQIRRE